MRIADFARDAVAIATPHRFQATFAPLAGQLAAHGVTLRAIVNGPAGELPAPDAADPPRWRCVPNLGRDGPPPDFRGPAGSWWQRRAFRLAVAEAALRGDRAALIFEDDAEFTPEAGAIIAGAEVPADWSMVYLGAMHHYGRTRDAGPNVVRVVGSLGTHAILLRHTVFAEVLALPPDGPLDDAIARRIHRRRPCYALYPSAVIQSAGRSTITGGFSAGPEFYQLRGGRLSR